jgi:hypothetical protein
MRLPTCLLALLLLPTTALADDEKCVPPPGGKCLSAEQFEKVKQALRELDDVYDSPAVIKVEQPVVIVQDWQGRVYVNGGDQKPIPMKLTIGKHVNRDMAVTLETRVFYREKPPDPMFRLRLRAQAGLLVPQLVDAAKGTKQNFFDGGLGLDFFHLGPVNVSANLGVFSSGGGLGLDLTKNFGVLAGYALAYDGWRSGVLAGAYFSFN